MVAVFWLLVPTPLRNLKTGNTNHCLTWARCTLAQANFIYAAFRRRLDMKKCGAKLLRVPQQALSFITISAAQCVLIRIDAEPAAAALPAARAARISNRAPPPGRRTLANLTAIRCGRRRRRRRRSTPMWRDVRRHFKRRGGERKKAWTVVPDRTFTRTNMYVVCYSYCGRRRARV